MVDLGVNVSAERFVGAVREQRPNPALIPALLTTARPKQGETIEAYVEVNLRDRVTVMVGGAPITHRWSGSTHADGYGVDAIVAVNLAKLPLDTPAR